MEFFLLYFGDAQCTFLLRLRFFHGGCIAGKTPTFPLNLIKRRLLPHRNGRDAVVLQGGKRVQRNGHGRLLSNRDETKQTELVALSERMENRECSITTMKFHRRRPETLRRHLARTGKFLRRSRDSLDGDCQRNGSVDFAGWCYRVPPKMSLILFR